jgi:hypothetical protein
MEPRWDCALPQHSYQLIESWTIVNLYEELTIFAAIAEATS